MPWGIAAAAVVGAYSANQQAKAGKAGANAQAQASADATAEQRRQFDLTRQDQMPWLQFGQQSLGQLSSLNSGDYSGFLNSPDYLAAQEGGLKLMNRGLAAAGTAGPQGFSGRADADRMALGQQMASQYLGNYRNALMGGAGLGQSTAQNLGGLGANMAGQIGNNAMNAANARASSYANTANAWGNYGNQLVGMIGQYKGWGGV